MNDPITVFWLPNCSTCKNAVAWLTAAKRPVGQFRDLKAKPLSRNEVERLVKMVGGASNLFSKRAQLYKSMGLASRKLSDSDMIELMTKEYTFIKRPVIVCGERVVSGFNLKAYEEFFGRDWQDARVIKNG
jgi:arsenate reductase